MNFLKSATFIAFLLGFAFNALADYQVNYKQCEEGQYISFSGEILFPTQEHKLKKILNSVKDSPN